MFVYLSIHDINDLQRNKVVGMGFKPMHDLCFAS